MKCYTCRDLKNKQLIEDFLLNHCQGMLLDSIQASFSMRGRWGINIDWHVFGDVMESMESRGVIAFEGFGADRMREYRMPKGIS